MSVMEIVVRAQDEASDVISGIGETVEETGSWIDENWGKVTAATGAAGAASEGFARSQQDTNATIGRMAARTGDSEDSIRNMLDGMTDATFSTHDAAASMEVLAQRGIDSRAEFEQQLPMWDEFADATGQDMPQAIEKATRGLGAFGIPASEAEDHIDTITFLSEEMDVEMDVLGRRLGRVSSEMDELGLGLDEGAAGIKVFTDRGMSSRDAMNEFRDAVKDSDGDLDQLLDNLGLTADEWEDYQDEVAGAEGMTAEFAEINNDTMTPLQRMQANLQNTMARYGGLADAAGMAAPVLMAMGPAMRGVSMATRGLGAAMSFLAANPIVLVIAAVAALVAGLIWAWNNSETFRDVVTGVFEAVAAAGRWLWENVLEPIWDAIKVGFDLLMEAAQAYWEVWQQVFSAAAEIVTWLWETIVEPIWDAIKVGFDLLMDAARAYRELWSEVFDAVGSAVEWVWDNVISPAWDAMEAGLDLLGDVAETLGEVWGNVWDGIKDAVKAVVNPIIGFINTIIRGAETMANAIGSAVNGIPSFTVPDWVPVLGGREFSLPTIPPISLPRIPTLHAGGEFRAPTPGGEGLALLRDREVVTTPETQVQLVALLQEVRDLLAAGQTIEVDGDTFGRVSRRVSRRHAQRNGTPRLA